MSPLPEARIALDLLLNNTVSEIVINDYDKGIYSFWKAILTETNRFINDVRTAELTVAEWERQHEIYISQQAKYSYEHSQPFILIGLIAPE